MMHHPIPKGRGADFALLGVMDHEVDIAAGLIGKIRKLGLQRQQMIGELMFKARC
ncbi:MAG: hypothetical protein KJ064_27490 [Anaerolineae bacterium]|nr:hypothetical protein [Anaerolineae bacterium]